jgi:hypothetical protein
MIGLVPLSIFNFLALPFAFISQTLLSYELAVVNFFSALSFAEVSFRGFSIAIVIGFYIVTIFWLLIFSKKGVDEPKA